MNARLHWRWFASSALLLAGGLAISMTQVACRGEGTTEKGSQIDDSAPVAHSTGLAAGPNVIAALGGLQVGQALAGYKVTWIGAVDKDGVVRMQLERGGEQMRLALAVDDGGPPPPVRAGKYALYYENARSMHAASEEACRRALKALAERILETEGHVAAPKGLGHLPQPAVTM